ncbi:MAG: BrnT family toxin [Candidatus Korobacteraceae bacterium]
MVRYEWDPAKNKSNKAKHSIDFETAQLIFDDPFCIAFIDLITDAEQRWKAIGAIEDVVLLVVAYTYRQDGADEAIRIISARRATPRERKLYAETVR